MTTYYSQGPEEKYIREFFGNRKSGRFLDIGAWDGKTFSNTYWLYEQGWSGVMVEASPYNIPKLIATFPNEPRITVVGALVEPTGGIKKFYDSHGDGISTTDQKHMEVWKKGGCRFTEIHLPSVTPEELLLAFPGPYEFVSIDTEGSSLDLFRMIDWNVTETECMVVEHNGAIKGIREYAKTTYDFDAVYADGTNVVFTRTIDELDRSAQ